MLGSIKASHKESKLLLLFVSVLFAIGAAFGTVLAGAMTVEQQQDLGAELDSFLHAMSAGATPDPLLSFWETLWVNGRWLLLIWGLGLYRGRHAHHSCA